MKTAPVFSALLSLAAVVSAGAEQKNIKSSTFKPPQVFKNNNLVHVISVEKNYVKENVNVVIENIAKTAQDDYYLPFTADQVSRLGSVEVKDRKAAEAGPFSVEVVELDPESDLQYVRIRLPKPLQPGSQQTLGITFYMLEAFRPLPASIDQTAMQYLSYSFSAYCPSVYSTIKQKTEVKLPSVNIQEYTKIPGSGDVKEFPQKTGSKLTYGPFDDKPAGAVEPVQVRYEFNKPVLHVSELEREVEVSHWGGNVAFEERYTLHNRAANLTKLFNRVKWQQSQYYPTAPTHALKELRFPLRVGSVDTYYTDVVGNVSTSRFRSNKREALLEAKPRYPLFGGWKYPFTIGWNSDAKNFLRRQANGGFVLNVPFLEGPKQAEGVAYGKVQVRVILPEGAENVKWHTNMPQSSIMSAGVEVHKTFLDTIGRPALVIKTRNLVDDLRERELVVTYDYPLLASLRKPLVIFGSMITLFAGTWLLGTVDLKFSSKK